MRFSVILLSPYVMPVALDLSGDTLAAAVTSVNTEVGADYDPILVVDFEENKTYRVIWNEDGSKELADNASDTFGPLTPPDYFAEAKIKI